MPYEKRDVGVCVGFERDRGEYANNNTRDIIYHFAHIISRTFILFIGILFANFFSVI